jgi:nitrogen fixation/metabolism regulation signal transduction histidine kinase
MKPAVAKAKDRNPLEDLGRATLQIVHDLKNQLNGLKLYATFLRKRLERDDQALEERETLAKLIAGLDRAASEMTALVRYSRPLELHRQPHIDLRKIIPSDARTADPRQSGDLTRTKIDCEIEDVPFYGEFDSSALKEAFDAITEEAISSIPQRDASQLSLHVSRTSIANSPGVLIEWQGLKPKNRNQSLTSFHEHATIHLAVAAKLIEAHEGQIKYDATAIRVSLPLSQ